MDWNSQSWLFYSLFLSLGAAGFLGITLLPLRAYGLIRRTLTLSSSSTRRAAFLLVVAAALVAAWLCGVSVVKVSRCLLGYHCSANRAGGWLFLATIGFWYAAFELFAAVVLLVAQRYSRVAT